MSDLYAVMGNPIGHSKSPVIHQWFAEQTGESLVYEAILAEPTHFVEAVDEFQNRGGLGLSVTVPFKVNAWRLANRRSERADQAGAVNTLMFKPAGVVYGDNTDGVGLVNDLTANLGVSLKQTRILMLGAGGAARGVLGPLLAASPMELVIANRTVSKAEQLAGHCGGTAPVRASAFDAVGNQPYDLIVNATAASLAGEIPPIPSAVVGPGTCCYDMMYARDLTPFLDWSAAAGAGRLSDGLGMLVEQAAEAFTLWRGTRPQTTPVLSRLRSELD